jgi:alkylhydroperoxidase family enzyme
MAHTAGASLRLGVSENKLAAIWEYRTSPLYTEAERVALDFALAAASQPNAVTDELFAKMKRHWSETQIVEIVGVVALFGWLNRFNDTMATPLEEEPIEVGEKFLAPHGWSVGRHRR